MSDRLNVAVIGAGVFGIQHVRMYHSYDKTNLVVVCETNPERAGGVRDDFGVEVIDDYMKIVDNPDIAAVSVVTPDWLHRDMVVNLLNAGKHVLVEKPLATTTGEAREMVQAARKNDRYLMVDFQNQFNPPFAEARKQIDAGAIGEPVTAWCRLANTLGVPLEMLKTWTGKSGPHWFLLPHGVDMICHLFKREVRSVVAFGRKGVLSGMGIDTWDAVQAMLFFDDCSAVVETSWIMPRSRPNLVEFGLVMQGTKGTIRLDPLHPILEIGGEEDFRWPITTAFYDTYGRLQGWQTVPMIHFADCLLEGRKPICTDLEGFHSTAVIEAVMKSVESGDKVEVETL